MRLHIPKDPTGCQRKFAFAEYTTAASARYAVALLEGLALQGQLLRVRIANANA